MAPLELCPKRRRPLGTLAVDHVSIAVEQNEFCVIAGPSGGGTSSLLYLAAGLAEVTSGDIRMCGRPITRRRRPPAAHCGSRA